MSALFNVRIICAISSCHSEGVEGAKNKVHLEGDRKEPCVYLGVCFHLLVHSQSPLIQSQIRTLRAKRNIVFLTKTFDVLFDASDLNKPSLSSTGVSSRAFSFILEAPHMRCRCPE